MRWLTFGFTMIGCVVVSMVLAHVGQYYFEYNNTCRLLVVLAVCVLCSITARFPMEK